MILKNITLPAKAIAEIYKYSLVDLKKTEVKPVKKTNDVSFLGGNTKHILLLTDNIDADFLPDSQLTFLSGILTACKLSMNDIAIVNTNKLTGSGQKNILDGLDSEIIILAGVDLSILELPFKIPLFQLQQYKQKKYVSIPSLYAIQTDPALKRKLWELLKILFSV